MSGRTEVVAELVKAGANLDLQDRVCQYIIHFNGYSSYLSYKTSCMFPVTDLEDL